jgi:predicted nucleotidyltransferase
MDDIDYFKATYGLRDCDVLIVPYGSRVYGTHKEDSDYDYMAIVPVNRRANTGEEYRRNDVNIHLLRAGSPYIVDARSAKRPSGARETADLAL